MQNYSVVTLIPIANLLEDRKYKLGEAIVSEGDLPKYFYIINQGRVKIVKEQIIVREAKLMETSLDENDKKKFQFSLQDCNN